MREPDPDPRLLEALEIARNAVKSAYRRGWARREDLEGDAKFGAVKAFVAFDPRRGTPFAAWVALYVKLTLESRRRKHAKAVKRAKDLARLADWRKEPVSREPTPGRSWADAESREFWKRAVSGMPRGIADAVLALHRDGLDVSVVAAQLGITEKAVRLRMDRAKDALRSNLRVYLAHVAASEAALVQPRKSRKRMAPPVRLCVSAV